MVAGYELEDRIHSRRYISNAEYFSRVKMYCESDGCAGRYRDNGKRMKYAVKDVSPRTITCPDCGWALHSSIRADMNHQGCRGYDA